MPFVRVLSVVSRGSDLHEPRRVGPAPAVRPRPPHTRGARPRPPRARECISMRRLRAARAIPTSTATAGSRPARAGGIQAQAPRHRSTWSSSPGRPRQRRKQVPSSHGAQGLPHPHPRRAHLGAEPSLPCAALGKSFNLSEPQ